MVFRITKENYTTYFWQEALNDFESLDPLPLDLGGLCEGPQLAVSVLGQSITHMLWAFSNGNTSTTSKMVLEWVIPDWWSLGKPWHEILHFWVQALPWTWHKQLHPGSCCYAAMWIMADAPAQGWVIRRGRKGESRTRWYRTPKSWSWTQKGRWLLGCGCLRQEKIMSGNATFIPLISTGVSFCDLWRILI